MGYSWPGNVRELENAIEHAIVLGLTEEILREDLPTGILEEQSAKVEGARYHGVLNQSKKDLILAALQESKGSYPEAARPRHSPQVSSPLGAKSPFKIWPPITRTIAESLHRETVSRAKLGSQPSALA